MNGDLMSSLDKPHFCRVDLYRALGSTHTELLLANASDHSHLTTGPDDETGFGVRLPRGTEICLGRRIGEQLKQRNGNVAFG